VAEGEIVEVVGASGSGKEHAAPSARRTRRAHVGRGDVLAGRCTPFRRGAARCQRSLGFVISSITC